MSRLRRGHFYPEAVAEAFERHLTVMDGADESTSRACGAPVDDGQGRPVPCRNGLPCRDHP